MRLMGVLALVVAVAVGAVAALWTYGKAAGAELDFCPGGGGCISGYWAAAGFWAIAVAAAIAGARLLRR